MAVEDGEILSVLDAVVSYLSITLPAQQLSPDAQMGREGLLSKVERLVTKINANKQATSIDSNDEKIEQKSQESGQQLDQDDVFYDDVKADEASKEAKEEDNRQRMSSYIDMTQFQPNPPNIIEPEATADQQENYEVPGESNTSEVVELLEEDEEDDEEQETYDDINIRPDGQNGQLRPPDNMNFELTDNDLLTKLKGFENTSAKKIAEDCVCAGWVMKLKKKVISISKWHKRYCILKEEFLFYYSTEEDKKALGVIVLPGYTINQEKTSKDKFCFKLTPPAKGRSTYLIQVSSKDEYDKWQLFLSPICAQKLNRLKSDAFNRIAKKMDGESDEGSAGEPVKAPEPPEPLEGDMYEFVPEDGLASGRSQDQSSSSSGGEIYDDVADGKISEDTYDDHIGVSSAPASRPPPPVQEEMYEGIPGESFEPEPSSTQPIEEDIYESIDTVAASSSRMNAVVASIPPRPSSESMPVPPSPALPPRTPGLPPRGQRPGKEEAPPAPLSPAPPSIPSRQPVDDEKSEQDGPIPLEEEEEGPSESDYSYDNVYIGVENHEANESDELAFKRGDLIYILQKINPNWWIGCMKDKVGLVPSAHLVAGFAH